MSTETNGQQPPANWSTTTAHPAPSPAPNSHIGYVPPGADLQRDDTITAPIPDWLIPANLKDKAARWNDLDAKVDAAEVELRAARIALAKAPAEDKAARKEALTAGKPFHGSPTHDKASVRYREAEANMRTYNELIREAGRALISALRAERAEVLHLTSERLAPALAAAREAVATAEALVRGTSEEVAEAGSGLALLESLDSNAPDWLGAFSTEVPKPDFNKHIRTLTTLESNLEVVETPLKPQFVNVKMHGVVSPVLPKTATMLIGFGGEEVPLYEGHTGLPTPERGTDSLEHLKKSGRS